MTFLVKHHHHHHQQQKPPPPPPPPPKKKYEIKWCTFPSSPVYPPILPPKRSTNRDDHLFPFISRHHFTFKSLLISLNMHTSDCSFTLFDKHQDFFVSIASKITPPCQYSLENGVKTFSMQFKFLRPFIYNLRTDESVTSFLQKPAIIKHSKVLQYKKPQNKTFSNYEHTSFFAVTNLYTLDWSKITLQNYEK